MSRCLNSRTTQVWFPRGWLPACSIPHHCSSTPSHFHDLPCPQSMVIPQCQLFSHSASSLASKLTCLVTSSQTARKCCRTSRYPKYILAYRLRSACMHSAWPGKMNCRIWVRVGPWQLVPGGMHKLQRHQPASPSGPHYLPTIFPGLTRDCG